MFYQPGFQRAHDDKHVEEGLSPPSVSQHGENIRLGESVGEYDEGGDGFIEIQDRLFGKVCEREPERDPLGKVIEYLP
jgi:hypothetical protein